MGDIITCVCVLKKSKDRSRPDHLALGTKASEDDSGYREIPCRPRGAKVDNEGKAIWDYEEKDGRLHLTPSLLCLMTGFHTDYHWSVAYEVCPDHLDQMYRFTEINPEYDPP